MRTRLLAILGATVIVVSACSSGGGASASPAASAPASVAPASEAPASSAPAESAAASAGTSFLERALAGEFKGTKVTASGPFVDEDAVKFNATMKDFEDKTGIDIQYTGTKEFEASIDTARRRRQPARHRRLPAAGPARQLRQDRQGHRPQGQARPDRPRGQLQPDLAGHGDDGRRQRHDHGRRLGAGQRQELRVVPQEGLRRRRLQGPHDVGRADRPAEQQIVADGDTPWCIGIESGAATGWPVTDWIEDFMLRTTSLDNYDKWVTGELKFSSPEVTNALTRRSATSVPRHEAGLRRHGRHRRTAFGRRAQGDVHRSAQVLAPPPGQLHHLVLPGRPPSRASTTTCSTCRASTRSTATRSSWPATSGRPSTIGPRSWP